MTKLFNELERENLRKDRLTFDVGDVVEVHYRIREGDKERIQLFTGTVIARRHGGMSESFTVRRIVAGEGVERTFPLHSPRIAEIRVRRGGRTRRAKLYFLRDRVGKGTRLRERKRAIAVEGEAEPAPVPAQAPEATAAEPAAETRAETAQKPEKAPKKKAAEKKPAEKKVAAAQKKG